MTNRIRPLHSPGTAVCALLLLSACASTPPIVPGPVPEAPLAGYGQENFSTSIGDDYILRPSDVIDITVFREPDLSLDDAVVSADGVVSLPLIGPVSVVGRNIADIVQEIEGALGARYLRNPEVSINIVEYASHRVTVEGEVEEPGLYSFQPGTRLSGAIALANGLTRVAEGREVAVFREGANGMEIAKFDYVAVRAGTMQDPVLMPGDRVVIGTDGLDQLWQDLLRALPVFALFTQI